MISIIKQLLFSLLVLIHKADKTGHVISGTIFNASSDVFTLIF